MRITADANILLRAVADDDLVQSPLAQRALTSAELVAITLPALCELVWVLTQGYKIPPRKTAEAIRRLIRGDNVAVDRQAVEAGLGMLDAGGDFADGIIAHEGCRLGATHLLTFDKQAAKLLGKAARLLA